jgi:hypothetical protein
MLSKQFYQVGFAWLGVQREASPAGSAAFHANRGRLLEVMAEGGMLLHAWLPLRAMPVCQRFLL